MNRNTFGAIWPGPNTQSGMNIDSDSSSLAACINLSRPSLKSCCQQQIPFAGDHPHVDSAGHLSQDSGPSHPWILSRAGLGEPWDFCEVKRPFGFSSPDFGIDQIACLSYASANQSWCPGLSYMYFEYMDTSSKRYIQNQPFHPTFQVLLAEICTCLSFSSTAF